MSPEAFGPLPAQAAFRHTGARDGFEVVFTRSSPRGHLLRGATTALDPGGAWSVGYEVHLDAGWRTRWVEASLCGDHGGRKVTLTRSDAGWTVDGEERPDLDGCVDVDFESSAVTSTMPVHRLDFGEQEMPAALVRACDLRVERIEQSYRYLGPSERGHVFAYRSSTCDVSAELIYDATGLVLAYPGLAERHLG